MTDDPPVHPHKTLTAPDGRQVDIDIAMVPLIERLWQMGLATTACCQNVGQATIAVRDQKGITGPYRGDDFIAYHYGWALLKMPRTDAIRLVDMLARVPALTEFIEQRWKAASWRMNVPLVHETGTTDLAEDALLHFPSDQISAISQALACITGEE
ncbi:hypothetical protein AB0903_24300 [Streptomyces sp. NPDC048389]|uniref:hypothetical protein n=1 Tax=Streptomyces sp. NPDC048389 TaxID=3154622 RepID=UPI003454CEC6